MFTSRFKWLARLLGVSMMAAAPAWGADEINLQLAGVPGDSLLLAYPSWIVVQSFSFSGTSANKCAGITIVHNVDSATGPLIKLALTGATVATGSLAVARLGTPAAVEYYRITMSGIVVSSVQDAESLSSTTGMLQNVTLKPQSYVVSVRTISAAGALNPAVTSTVDCVANTVN